jgi:hypothetical protein
VTSTFPATVVLGQSAQPANGRNTAGEAVSVVIPIVIGNSASANRAAQEFQVEPRGSGFGRMAPVAASTSALLPSFPRFPSLK